MSTKPTLKAYLAHAPFCKFSEQFVDFATICGFELSIHDVTLSGIPLFLAGTPSILLEDGNIYCGDAAFSYVNENAVLAPEEECRITEPVQPKLTSSGMPTNIFEGMQFPPANRTNVHIPPSRDDLINQKQQNQTQNQLQQAKQPMFAASNESGALGGALFTPIQGASASNPVGFATQSEPKSMFGTKVEKPNKKQKIDVENLMAERSNTIRLV